MESLITLQKQQLVAKLKERGCRITKQRLLILDILLEGSCASCKDIYYKASRLDPSIGTATVYRMVNLLEEIGALRPGSQYQIRDTGISGYRVSLSDGTSLRLTAQDFRRALASGLKHCGYSKDPDIIKIEELKTT